MVYLGQFSPWKDANFEIWCLVSGVPCVEGNCLEPLLLKGRSKSLYCRFFSFARVDARRVKSDDCYRCFKSWLPRRTTGGKFPDLGPETDGIYSQPLARAIRAASTRLAAPILLIASDR